jgi:hypothetical protein
MLRNFPLEAIGASLVCLHDRHRGYRTRRVHRLCRVTTRPTLRPQSAEGLVQYLARASKSRGVLQFHTCRYVARRRSCQTMTLHSPCKHVHSKWPSSGTFKSNIEPRKRKIAVKFRGHVSAMNCFEFLPFLCVALCLLLNMGVDPVMVVPNDVNGESTGRVYHRRNNTT